MMNIWRGIDTDDKLTVAAEVKRCIQEFFDLGIQQVEAACNDRRNWLRASGGHEVAKRIPNETVPKALEDDPTDRGVPCGLPLSSGPNIPRRNDDPALMKPKF